MKASAKPKLRRSSLCVWAEDEDGNWWTSCGEGFVTSDGTPEENGFNFCCYCGFVLVQKRVEQPLEEAA